MSVAARYGEVLARVARAAERVGRAPHTVKLIAVTKTQPAAAVRAAYAAGARVFGENRVQELREKQAELADLVDIEWHLVGRLQTNKAKDVVGRVALVHAVDSVALADALNRRTGAAGLRQDVLVQVNLSGEGSKAGVVAGELPALLAHLGQLPALTCTGLMTLPPPVAGPEDNRAYFGRLAELGAAHGLTELSMGMTGDFEVAVAEGATMVRVGTAIFGAR